MLRDRVDRVDPLQCAAAHSGNARRTRQPASVVRHRRRSRTTTSGADEHAEQAGVDRTAAVQRLLQPDRAPERRCPASSTVAAKDRLFQLIDSTPATTSAGIRTTSGEERSAADPATNTTTASAISRNGRRRLPERPTSARLRCAGPSEQLEDRETAATCPGDKPRRSWRNSTVKPTTHICGATTSALPTEIRQMRRSRSGVMSQLSGVQGPGSRGGRTRRRPRRQHTRSPSPRTPSRCHLPARSAAAQERRERADRIAVCLIPRARPRSPNPESRHHRAPARRLHARAEEPGEHEQKKQRLEGTGPGGAELADTAASSPPGRSRRRRTPRSGSVSP